MSLLPKEIEEILPPLYSTENENDPIVHVRFYHPFTNPKWEWFLTEYSKEEKLCFGLVSGNVDAELGYFSLFELETIENIQRVLDFKPKRLSKIHEERIQSSI